MKLWPGIPLGMRFFWPVSFSSVRLWKPERRAPLEGPCTTGPWHLRSDGEGALLPRSAHHPSSGGARSAGQDKVTPRLPRSGGREAGLSPRPGPRGSSHSWPLRPAGLHPCCRSGAARGTPRVAPWPGRGLPGGAAAPCAGVYSGPRCCSACGCARSCGAPGPGTQPAALCRARPGGHLGRTCSLRRARRVAPAGGR